MKIEKSTSYDAGYSKAELLKKCTAAVAASALICGGLASCNSFGGRDERTLDGDVAISSDECLDIAGEQSYIPDDECITLDGDIAYASSESCD